MDIAAIMLTGLTFMVIPEDDKKQHFAAGAAVSLMSQEVFGLSPLQSCGMALAAGVTKELYDRRFGGVAAADDVYATLAGCMITFRF